jgi:hypothetical protein
MTRSNDIYRLFYTIFYRDSIVVYLGVVYEYESILVILIDIILLINMKFDVKYY